MTIVYIIIIVSLVFALWGFWWRAERFEDELSKLRAVIVVAARAGCRCSAGHTWSDGPCGSCVCQDAIGKEERDAKKREDGA